MGVTAQHFQHVLTKCPLPQRLQRKLRDKIGDKCNSLVLMLGGRPQSQLTSDNSSSSKEDWKITSTELNAVLDFAKESERFGRKEDTEN